MGSLKKILLFCLRTCNAYLNKLVIIYTEKPADLATPVVKLDGLLGIVSDPRIYRWGQVF